MDWPLLAWVAALVRQALLPLLALWWRVPQQQSLAALLAVAGSWRATSMSPDSPLRSKTASIPRLKNL